MKYPRNTAELLKMIFCWIGIVFVAFGMLALRGIMGVVFLAVGVVFLLVQTALKVVVLSKAKNRGALLTNIPIPLLGKAYHHKVGFLWKKPTYAEQDPIVVCVDDKRKSTVCF